MSTSYCTACGEILQGEWKHCPSCGTLNANRETDELEDSPTLREASPDQSIEDPLDELESEFLPHIDRRIAYQCAFRWAILGGVTVWALVALFMPINATYTTQSRNARGVAVSAETVVSCPTGAASIFGGSKIRPSAEEQACSDASKPVWLIDGGISGLVWAVLVLGLAYLINRNRFVRNESLWFPYRHSLVPANESRWDWTEPDEP